MTTLQQRIETATDKMETDQGLLHDIVHGGPTETVTTEGGTVPTVAKKLADLDAAYAAAGAVASCVAAKEGAEAAQGLAEDARDAAQGYAAVASSDAAEVAAALATLGGESVDKVNASVTLTAASNRHIVIVNAAAGQVVVTLPLGAAIGEPGSISIQKLDSTANTVLVRVQATDTINGGTADYELTTQYQGARFAVDLDVDPDDWAALPFGAGAVTQAAFDALAEDVSDHEARLDALEVALAGIEAFPGVQGNLVTNETKFPIGTVVFAKIDSAYIDRNKAAAVYISSARSDLYTLSSASGLRLAGTWVARGTDQSYGTELMQRVA